MKYRYEIPQGLTDEIKWFKYFSLRTLIIAVIVAAIGIPIIMLLDRFGITVYLIVFWAFITIVIALSTMVRIPNTNWMNGGGEYIDQVFIKRMIRKRNRCLYIKGYNQVVYEEKEREWMLSGKGETK